MSHQRTPKGIQSQNGCTFSHPSTFYTLHCMKWWYISCYVNQITRRLQNQKFILFAFKWRVQLITRVGFYIASMTMYEFLSSFNLFPFLTSQKQQWIGECVYEQEKKLFGWYLFSSLWPAHCNTSNTYIFSCMRLMSFAAILYYKQKLCT